MRRLASPRSRLTALLIGAAFLAGCGATAPEKTSGAVRPAAPASLAVPAALIDEGLDLRAGPMAVPLELRLPTLDLIAPVVGVGITPTNVMDAPMGPADDPVWQQAFWYRGSAVPGALSTALFAGHVGGFGRPSVFADIDQLRSGDLIVVHDTRDGLDVRFSVTESKSYTLAEASDPAVLTQIYGAGPVEGNLPEPSADGLSHLTLVTCAGEFKAGTHDHRLAVYATRIA
jgi:hypothetical protein